MVGKRSLVLQNNNATKQNFSFYWNIGQDKTILDYELSISMRDS